jgi:DNA-binding response OmpR family regulator
MPRLDVRKTKQIIYNLLANAVKFTSNGGSATLRARRVPRSAVGTIPGDWSVQSFPLADSAHTEYLELCVSDNGIGVSVANMAKLFRPFSQIDSSLGRKFEGTGLGLATVKQLAELHGGGVAVASAAGEGSTFVAWLPMLENSEDARPTAQPLESETRNPSILADRVALVIEDDMTSADQIRLLLEAEGFTVVHAATAEDATLLAPKQALSLITLDIQLPGINGWEFLEGIRKSSTFGRVPVLVFGGQSYNNAVLTNGAAAVLQKPITRAQLHASLDDLGLHSTKAHARTVLIVDDDPKAVEMIAAFLLDADYEVARAYGGQEAIQMARRTRPDLIVLDLMMPDVSGFDVVDALQREAGTAHIPILVVTAKTVTAEDRAALSHSPDGIIQIVAKHGFDRNHFISAVRRSLVHDERAH